MAVPGYLGAQLNARTRHVIGAATQLARVVGYGNSRPLGTARTQRHPAAIDQHPPAARQGERRNHEIAGAFGADHVVDQDLPALVVVAAGLDVFRSEPNYDTRFARLNNVILSPHIGSGSVETRNAMGFRALDNIAAVLSGKGAIDPLWT